MLATTLGIPFDPETAWSERDQVFKMEKAVLKTRNVVQSAEGHPKGLWSTVVALGVFIFFPHRRARAHEPGGESRSLN